MPKMNKSKIPVASFVPSCEDVIIFDSNILIQLFYPLMYEKQKDGYAALYSKIMSVKSKLIISSIQISEFVNRCIRFQYDLYKKEHGEIDFKNNYRNTEDYRNCMNAILDIIRLDIQPHFIFINDGFDSMDRDSIFRYGFSYDFNDALVIQIAKQNNATLVTDDKDFANYTTKVRIVTNNKALLMFS